MKTSILTIAIALALGTVAGCDRNPEQRAAGTGASQPRTETPQAAQSNPPSTPANAGTPSAGEKKDGANPVQGQVDPKQGAQHKDFQQRGDGTGPKPGG